MHRRNIRCAVRVPGHLAALRMPLGTALERLKTASRLQVPASGAIRRVAADGGLQNVSLGIRTSETTMMLVTAELVNQDGDGQPIFDFRVDVPPYEDRPAYICHPEALAELGAEVPGMLFVRDKEQMIEVGRAYPEDLALKLLEPFMCHSLGLVWCRHPRIPRDWAAVKNHAAL